MYKIKPYTTYLQFADQDNLLYKKQVFIPPQKVEKAIETWVVIFGNWNQAFMKKGALAHNNSSWIDGKQVTMSYSVPSSFYFPF